MSKRINKTGEEGKRVKKSVKSTRKSYWRKMAEAALAELTPAQLRQIERERHLYCDI